MPSISNKAIVLLGKSIKAKYIQTMSKFFITQMRLSNSRFRIAILPLRNNKKNDGGVILHDKSTIVIFLNLRQSPKDLATTLAHEYVHVRQICRGLLKHVDATSVLWRGKKYSDNTPYLERPWELQALREQDILVRLFEDQFTSKRKRVKIDLRNI
jgi:hypothetical protein